MSTSHKHHPAHHPRHNPPPPEEIPEMYVVDDTQQAFEHDVKTYLSWHAPGRPFKEHSKEYFVNGFLIMSAVEIIIYLVFKDALLMVLVFSFVFFSFALAIVPPRMFYYKITSEGILIEDHFFIWEELYDFYFLKHNTEEVLHVRTKAFFPGELTITLGDLPITQVKNALLPFLPYREYVKPTFTEQAGDWLQRNFPLEKRA